MHPQSTPDISSQVFFKLKHLLSISRSPTFPEVLELKVGAKVMLVTTLSKELVNGSTGIVTGFSTDSFPIVKFHDVAIVTVKPVMLSVKDRDVIVQIRDRGLYRDFKVRVFLKGRAAGETFQKHADFEIPVKSESRVFELTSQTLPRALRDKVRIFSF